MNGLRNLSLSFKVKMVQGLHCAIFAVPGKIALVFHLRDTAIEDSRESCL
jgi:hypothetical protein